MNWVFTLVDKNGTPIDGETFLDGVSQGAFSGTDTLALDDNQHEIIFVPDQQLIDSVLTDVYNTYTNIIPTGYGDSIIGDPEITIIFQELTDFEPICAFEILRLACNTDILVLYTVASSVTPRLLWNYGDGVAEEFYGILYAVHKYQSFGEFTVTLLVTLCHDDIETDEDGCPCRTTIIYSEAPVAVEVTVVGDVHYYQVSIDNFYRGNCCQDGKIPLAIYVNGVNEGTSYGGLTLITTFIDEIDNVINFSNDLSIVAPVPIDTQFVVKGDSANPSCNTFAIPLVFDFSNFDGTL
jgi:hypothetical protein